MPEQIKVYGDEPDIRHLPEEQQAEIRRQIKIRTRELRRDMERALVIEVNRIERR